MKNKSYKKKGFFYNIFVTALCMYVQYAPRVLYGSTQRGGIFFLETPCKSESVSTFDVPFISMVEGGFFLI